MYDKIITLKTKLANFNQSSQVLNKNAETKKILSSTFIADTSPIHTNLNSSYDSKALNTSQNGQPVMSKISELKKKWNEVSNKSKAFNPSEYTPDKSNNLNDSISSQARLTEIKSKYNGSKFTQSNFKK
jgi:hypothetical protein